MNALLGGEERLRFGDARVQALLQTLCLFVLLPRRFRNADLRTHVAALYLRIVRPGWATMGELSDDIPRPLRGALEQVDIEVARICEEAQIRTAA